MTLARCRRKLRPFRPGRVCIYSSSSSSFHQKNRVRSHLDRTERITMAFQGSEGLEEQSEEPEDTLRVSPAEEMPVDGPPAVDEPLLLPWDRFSSWLHCICVVGFDLELGQAVEV